MKVLVACEYSGRVRDAFLAKGHDAMSCDFLPTDVKGPHYQGGVFDILGQRWDLMIAHPPCTYLCSSGLFWNKKRPERQQLTEKAIEFVQKLMSADIPKIALENPIGCLSTKYRKPDCIVQPYEHGHSESKATCLWLKNLPKLKPSQIMTKPLSGHWLNQTPSGQNKLGPSLDRWKLRSTTYEGIAKAMANQWG